MGKIKWGSNQKKDFFLSLIMGLGSNQKKDFFFILNYGIGMRRNGD
jgi:hypothetical protein